MAAPKLHPRRVAHERLADEVLQAQPVLYAKIARACGIRESEVSQALAEVIRFLNLIAFSGRTLAPAQNLDLAWHEFILCTRAYMRFCRRHFGRIIHHTPEGNRRVNNARFQETVALYKEHFGSPDPRFWGARKPAECGSCEG